MKNLKLLFLLSLFAPTELYSSHIVGGEMHYKSLGGMDYYVTLILYRDCNGVIMPQTVNIDVASAAFQHFAAPLDLLNSQEITPVCPSMSTFCNGGQLYGYEAYMYGDTVSLTGADSNWVFSYSSCCRGGIAGNLVNPYSDAYYISAYLNNTLGPNNSSVFINLSPIFLSGNTLQTISFHAMDLDGDSLVYSLVPTMTDAATPAAYLPPFSASYPYQTPSGTVHFYPISGLLIDTVIAVQTPVICVEVEEYRNGKVIGKVRRDIDMAFLNQSNSVPTISGMDSLPVFDTIVHVGDTLNFDVYAADNDFLQTLLMDWDSLIPGANFQITYSPLPVGHFSWAPDTNAIGNINLLPVYVTDNFCPYEGWAFKLFAIHVLPALPVGLFLKNDYPTIRVYPIPAKNIVHFAWNENISGEYMVYDISGKLVDFGALDHTSAFNWDSRNFNSGLYLWKMETDRGALLGKLLLSK